MRIDPSFVYLTADVLGIFFMKNLCFSHENIHPGADFSTNS